jgi:preprotein translocase subunit SecA
MNTQRLAIYGRRRAALLGNDTEVEILVRSLLEGNESALSILEEKKQELGPSFTEVVRRHLLQIIDTFWLEHLEMMDYLRRSVSLRAYGQRDPLIEYRREGLILFRKLEGNIVLSLAEVLPRIASTDDTRIRAEEDKLRANVFSVNDSHRTEPTASLHASTHGRNDMVTVTKGDISKTLKFKKAEALLSEGWTLTESS